MSFDTLVPGIIQEYKYKSREPPRFLEVLFGEDGHIDPSTFNRLLLIFSKLNKPIEVTEIEQTGPRGLRYTDHWYTTRFDIINNISSYYMSIIFRYITDLPEQSIGFEMSKIERRKWVFSLKGNINLIMLKEPKRRKVYLQLNTSNLTEASLKIVLNYSSVILKILEDTVELYRKEETQELAKVVNSLLHSRESKKEGVIDKGVLAQARNLKLRDMVSGGLIGGNVRYTVSHKADGIRRLLVISNSGIWLVMGPSYYNLLTRNTIKELTGTIIECEEIPEESRLEGAPKTKYWLIVYNCLSFPGESNTMEADHIVRMRKAESIIRKIEDSGIFSKLVTFTILSMKHFDTADDFFIVMKAMFVEQLELQFKQDGFMFTPDNTPYTSGTYRIPLEERILTKVPDICKWKPNEKMTIDFRLGIREEKWVLYTYENVFQGTEKWPFDPNTMLNIPNNYIAGEGDIVEFAFKDGQFIPTRIRYDKNSPNSKEIAEDVWTDIHEPISRDTLTGIGTVLLDAFLSRERESALKKLDKEMLLLIGPIKHLEDVSLLKMFNNTIIIEPFRNTVAELKRLTSLYKLNEKIKIVEGEFNPSVVVQYILPLTGGKLIKSLASFDSLEYYFDNKEHLKEFCDAVKMIMNWRDGTLSIVTKDGDSMREFLTPSLSEVPVREEIFIDSMETELIRKKSLTNLRTRSHENFVHFMALEMENLRPKLGSGGIELLNRETFLNPDENIKKTMSASAEVHYIQPQPPVAITLPVVKESVVVIDPLPAGECKRSPTTNRQYLSLISISPYKDLTRRALNDDAFLPLVAPCYTGKLVRFGTIGDGSCFIHSVLKAFYKPYMNNASYKFRTELVWKLRRDLAELLGKKPAAGAPTYYESLEVSKTGLPEHSLENLRTSLKTAPQLGDEIMAFFADVIGVNILVLRGYVDGVEHHAYYRSKKKSPYNVIIVGNSCHFETVGMDTDKGFQTVFYSDTPESVTLLKSLGVKEL